MRPARTLLAGLLLLGACTAKTPEVAQSDLPAEVSVYFATDRNPAPGQPLEARYGLERGDLSYGQAVIALPRDHRLGQFEAPLWWQEQNTPRPGSDITLNGVEDLDRAQFLAGLAGADQLLILVHGYNMSFSEALRRTGQIAYDLQALTTSVLFTWPSQANPALYTHDAANAEWAESDLQALLETLRAQDPSRRLNLIAHSMGAKIVLAALERLADDQPAGAPPVIDQLIFAAPDIDTDVMAKFASELLRVARRVSVYASERDIALAASKKLNGHPRAGELAAHLPDLAGLDVIDVTSLETDFSGHSYYSDNRVVLGDFYELLASGRPPAQRFGLRKVERPGASFWTFAR